MRSQASEEDTTSSASDYAYEVLRETTNGAQGDYNGFQVQFRRMMTRNLQMQLSYTWGHSIDTASSLASIALSSAGKVVAEHAWECRRNHTVEVLPEIDRLLSDPARLEAMRDRAAALAKPDAASTVVRTLIEDALPPLKLDKERRQAIADAATFE